MVHCRAKGFLFRREIAIALRSWLTLCPFMADVLENLEASGILGTLRPISNVRRRVGMPPDSRRGHSGNGCDPLFQPVAKSGSITAIILRDFNSGNW
jgi:hypothetical protein